MNRRIATILIGLLVAGCKVSITVPQGGVVVSQSGSIRCEAGQTCTIDVYDIYFDETFEAIPAAGYSFVEWRQRDRGLCGGDDKPCQLQTTGFEGNANLLAVLESDEVFYLEPVFEVTPPTLIIYGGSDAQFFLGCLNCPTNYVESVCNTRGNFGSTAGIYSIWNNSGDFGSVFSNFSPWNPMSMKPPEIYDLDGVFYGYFTANPALPGRTRISTLVNLTNAAATGRYDMPTLRGAWCQQFD